MKSFECFIENKISENQYDLLLTQVAESLVVNEIDPQVFTNLYLEFMGKNFFKRDPVSGYPYDVDSDDENKSSWGNRLRNLSPNLVGKAASLAGRGLGAAGGALAGGLLGGPGGALAGGYGGWKLGANAGDKFNRKMNYNHADEVRKLDIAKHAIADLIQSQMAYVDQNPQMQGYFSPKIEELQRVKKYLDSGLKGNLGDQFADYWMNSSVPFSHDTLHGMMYGVHPFSHMQAGHHGYSHNPYGGSNPYMSHFPSQEEIDAVAAAHKKQPSQAQSQSQGQEEQQPSSSPFGATIDTSQVGGSSRTPDFNGSVVSQDGSYYVPPTSWPVNPEDDMPNTSTVSSPKTNPSGSGVKRPVKAAVQENRSFTEWLKKKN